MSSHKHATVSAWQRDHDGNYSAELNGYKLSVTWEPETDRTPRGFRWTAESPDGSKFKSDDSHEEIELAMAEAETFTEGEESETAA